MSHPLGANPREDLRQTLMGYRNRAQWVSSLASDLANTVEAITCALEAGEPVGKLSTLFGMTDLAAKVNDLSRWEGRLWEVLDAALKDENKGGVK